MHQRHAAHGGLRGGQPSGFGDVEIAGPHIIRHTVRVSHHDNLPAVSLLQPIIQLPIISADNHYLSIYRFFIPVFIVFIVFCIVAFIIIFVVVFISICRPVFSPDPFMRQQEPHKLLYPSGSHAAAGNQNIGPVPCSLRPPLSGSHGTVPADLLKAPAHGNPQRVEPFLRYTPDGILLPQIRRRYHIGIAVRLLRKGNAAIVRGHKHRFGYLQPLPLHIGQYLRREQMGHDYNIKPILP